MTTPLDPTGDSFDWRDFRLSLPPVERIEDEDLRKAIRRLYEAARRRDFVELAGAALELAHVAVWLDREKAEMEDDLLEDE